MKAVQLSGGVHVDSGWITTLGGVITAAIGGCAVWLAQRVMGKAAFQTAINSGFQGLVDQLQEERVASREVIGRLYHDLEREREVRSLEREARNLERIATAAERAQLRGEIINLTQVIEGLKRIMREGGLPVPEAHILPLTAEEPVMVQLEQRLDYSDDNDYK